MQWQAGPLIHAEATEEDEREFVDTEERVQEVLAEVASGQIGIGVEVVTGGREEVTVGREEVTVGREEVTGGREVRIEERQEDRDERSVVTAMLQETCGCRKGVHSRPCSLQFTAEQVSTVRGSCSELGQAELDMVVMGQLMAGMNDNPTTNPVSRNRTRERRRAHYSLLHRGQPVCEKMFRFLHNIGDTRYKNLKKSLRSHGLATRSHGNIKRSPAHALSLSATEFVIRFVMNYAEQHALLLPGRVPGYSRSDIRLLPSSVSKRGIWKVYQTVAVEGSIRAVAYSTFTLLWRSLLPSIILMKPMTDLCWQCQQASAAIQRSANLSEEEKSEAVQVAQEHLRIVQLERSVYTASCEECSRSVRAHFTTGSSFLPPGPACRMEPNSNAIKAHYSFDYAQQVCSIQNTIIILTTPSLIGPLSIRPTTARSNLFSNSKEVFRVWSSLRGDTPTNQLPHGRVR